MVQIVKEYGLIPVPVDISLETTAPTMDDIKAVTTPKVKFIRNYRPKFLLYLTFTESYIQLMKLLIIVRRKVFCLLKTLLRVTMGMIIMGIPKQQ